MLKKLNKIALECLLVSLLCVIIANIIVYYPNVNLLRISELILNQFIGIVFMYYLVRKKLLGESHGKN